MPVPETTPPTVAAAGLPARAAHSAAVPLARLLAGLALATLAASGFAVLAFERLHGAAQPPRPAPLAPAAPTPPSPATPTLSSVPAAYEVLRDRTDPPAEAAPTF